MAAGFDALVARESVKRDVLEVERLGAEVFLAEVVAPLASRKLHRLRVVGRRHRRDEPTVAEQRVTASIHQQVFAVFTIFILSSVT